MSAGHDGLPGRGYVGQPVPRQSQGMGLDIQLDWFQPLAMVQAHRIFSESHEQGLLAIPDSGRWPGACVFVSTSRLVICGGDWASELLCPRSGAEVVFLAPHGSHWSTA